MLEEWERELELLPWSDAHDILEEWKTERKENEKQRIEFRNDILKQIGKLQAEREKLIGALYKYGKHTSNCEWEGTSIRDAEMYKCPDAGPHCTCGLDAVLAEVREKV